MAKSATSCGGLHDCLNIVYYDSAMTIFRIFSAILLLASLSACASHRGSGGGGGVASRGMYKVGNPYQIDGVTYVPQEEFNHVETGVASWYGPGFHTKATANGETYDQRDHTAAHRTLQMPSIVRVTNLDNGRSTVVRVNDRGPYARGRIIDMSQAAAEELAMTGKGTARVRIDQLAPESQTVKEVAVGGGGPSEQQAALAQLASGQRAPAMAAAPAPTPTATLMQPPPVQATTPAYVPFQPASPPLTPDVMVRAQPSQSSGQTVASIASASGSSQSGGTFYVQTGAFSTMNNAARQREQISSYGATEVFQAQAAGRDVFRVRVGPYTTPDAAGLVADRLKRSGYGEARVVTE
jgi:rare lipoprotein A